MKSILKNLVVVVTVLFSFTSAFANTNPTVRLDKGKILLVDLNDWSNSTVQLVIKDLEGIILHSDNFLSEAASGIKYNLKNLPAGNYKMVIENDRKKEIHSLQVSNESVLVNSVASAVVYKSSVTFDGKSIALNQLALGRDITISIADKSGAFFTQKYKNLPTVNKRFDISDLPSGKYIFTVEGKEQYDTFVFAK